MKHNVLRSVAHNIADSLAGGNGFLIGLYETDIYGEASRSPSGYITVDFVQGRVVEGSVSRGLEEAVRLYRIALRELCGKQGVLASDFSELVVRFFGSPSERRFTVTVVDQDGRQSIGEYGGLDSQRTKMVDDAGHLRTKPILRSVGQLPRKL